MLNIEMGNTLMHSLVRARTLAQRSGFCNVNICTGVMWTSAHQTAGMNSAHWERDTNAPYEGASR